MQLPGLGDVVLVRRPGVDLDFFPDNPATLGPQGKGETQHQRASQQHSSFLHTLSCLSVSHALCALLDLSTVSSIILSWQLPRPPARPCESAGAALEAAVRVAWGLPRTAPAG